MDEEDEDFEIDGTPGMGIEAELHDGQCQSLQGLLEMVTEAIRRLPADVDPRDVTVAVAGHAADGNGTGFFLQDLFFMVGEDDGDWGALLITDGSGEDEVLSKM